MSEKEELGTNHIGKLVRLGDFYVRQGAIIKVGNGNRMFIVDHQVEKSDQGGGSIPEGSLVSNRVLTDHRDLVVGRSPRRTILHPDEKGRLLGMMVLSVVESAFPIIIRERRPKNLGIMEERKFGFKK